jgi:multiple sugar transport system substrate-binding protein
MKRTMKGKLYSSGVVAMASLIALSVIVGCNSTKTSTDEEPGASTRKLEPVTIRVFNIPNTSEAYFNEFMKGPVEKKYPHITLESVPNQKGSTLPELMTANNLPDMVYGKVDAKQQVMIDLEPLFNKYKFDVNKIKPRIWEAFVTLTGTEKKLFVPFTTSQHILYYNKGIFDRFGVPYPKDGMTWDETYELAKQVTRTDNGINYLGFNFRDSLNFTQSPQKLLPLYDDKTGSAAVNSDVWKNYFANFARFFEIPGNNLKSGDLSKEALFVKEQRVALYAANVIFNTLIEEKDANGLDWDVVSLPVFPDAPKQGSAPNTNGLGITVASRHPDDAFLVIETLLSHDAQLLKARKAPNESVLVKDEQMQKEYGKGAGLEGKNIKALFYNEYGPSRKPSEYNDVLNPISTKYFRKIVYEKLDINTALRQAEEEMNKAIETEKKAAK